MAIIIFKHCPSILLEKSSILIYLINCEYKNCINYINYVNYINYINYLFSLNFLKLTFLNFLLNVYFLHKFAILFLYFLYFSLTVSLISFILCRIVTSCITPCNFLAYSSHRQGRIRSFQRFGKYGLVCPVLWKTIFFPAGVLNN
jgi:hypothetical protein